VSRKIHVACGDGAAGMIIEELSISRTDIVSLRDDLSCGPLSALGDLESWGTMRQAYWEQIDGEPPTPKERRRRAEYWRRADLLGGPDRLADSNEVVIWLGTGVADQLALAWMPQLLRAVGGRAETLRVVQFERTVAGKAIPTLSIINSPEFQSRPRPRPIDGEELAYLDKAWGAVTASDPVALIQFLGHLPSPLPLLLAAIRKIAWGYPDIRSGVNRFDAQLLVSTRDDGPAAAGVIASSMRAFFCEGKEFIGDKWLFWRLQRLADPTLPARP
jgi:hypothetical protein